MYVGQRVWHVGKNVVAKEVVIVWLSPDIETNLEAPVLVERPDRNVWDRYALIPNRQISIAPPIRRCNASFLPHMAATTLFCDRAQGHITLGDAYHVLHHVKTGFREVYWTDETPQPA